VTPYRLALALPLLLVLVSGAWAQGTQPNATQAPPAAADQQADEPIGNVATLTGTATVTRNNAATPLKLKDDIYLNDVVATAATSSLGITFNDATTFTLKANAQVTIDNYVYEDGAKNNSGIFDIARGTVAFAAAAVAKTGSMQITTPTAALGIRGTTGVVEVPEGGAAATTANNIKLYPDADGRVGQIEVNDRQGRRLGALTTGASGFAIRGGSGGARFAAVPLAISPQQAQRDQGFVRQLHAAQTAGRQIVSQQRAFRRANPQYRNPARPQRPGQQNRPGQRQPGTTPNNRPGQQPTTPNNRPGQQGAPNRQGQQQQPGGPQQPGAPARPGQSPAGAAPSGAAPPNALPRTPGAPLPGSPGVGPRTGAAPGLPPGVGRPGGPRPRLPGAPKGKPEKKRH
jgi:hypothetical protein